MAYANRSAVYLEAELFKECLQNIDWARENYPKNKIQKLKEREEKCKKLIEESADKPKDIPEKFFKLTYPLGCTEERDKKHYATVDLNPGDIVFIGQIRDKFLPQPFYVNQCYGCFKVNSMNLIPSLQNAMFMYCSEECRQKPYVVNEYETSHAKMMRNNHGNRLMRNCLTYDPTPFYDEFDCNYTALAQSPFSSSKKPNVSYFHFDGIYEIFFVSKPIKAGDMLSTNTM